MDTNILTLEAIKNYYKILKKTGTLEYAQVYKLVLLVFLNDLINNYSWYITEKDCEVIYRILGCITNTTCIVPSGWQILHTEPVNNYLLDMPVRISEDEILRIATSDALRIANAE